VLFYFLYSLRGNLIISFPIDAGMHPPNITQKSMVKWYLIFDCSRNNYIFLNASLSTLTSYPYMHKKKWLPMQYSQINYLLFHATFIHQKVVAYSNSKPD